ncbi:hypothetical protein SAMN04515624_13511 [Eubacterium maltosivorans]|uniref:hypothetical protein n=1 Tax=Eubacterium maltosivorans TaxID=2041044 RepID=UPI00088E37DD|nr:hypothetical protein [Eubacterium maltosivorans]WPK80908.1 hypothetical protein EUMA32_23260 [Eubacterium maltosivorans]SDP82352.1 hypothetical protein SAMN04515624_13511 [Eubacterium maltosivorans]
MKQEIHRIRGGLLAIVFILLYAAVQAFYAIYLSAANQSFSESGGVVAVPFYIRAMFWVYLVLLGALIGGIANDFKRRKAHLSVFNLSVGLVMAALGASLTALIAVVPLWASLANASSGIFLFGGVFLYKGMCSAPNPEPVSKKIMNLILAIILIMLFVVAYDQLQAHMTGAMAAVSMEERVGVTGKILVVYNFLVTPLLTLLLAAGACFVAWFRTPRPAFDVRHLLFALACLALYGGTVYMMLDGRIFASLIKSLPELYKTEIVNSVCSSLAFTLPVFSGLYLLKAFFRGAPEVWIKKGGRSSKKK